MRVLYRPLKWLWVALLLGGVGLPLASDCLKGLLLGTGCAPWKPALGFIGNYGIWVGLVLLMLAALTFLARRDERIYQVREQSQQRLEEARKMFELLKPCSQLLPEDLGYQRREPGQLISQEKRPYFEKYIPRIAVSYEQRTEENPQPQYDKDTLARYLKKGKGFVLLGPPLDGKSRTLYEILSRVEGCDVIKPTSSEPVPDEEIFSLLFKDKRIVVVLDDLTDYVDENKVNLKEFTERLGRHASSWAVASTCRDGPELSAVRDNPRQDFKRFYDEIPLKLTLLQASPQDKQDLAEAIGKGPQERDWEQFPHLGEIPMEDPMREMKSRFDRLSHNSPEQRDSLRSLKLLTTAGVLPITRERLRAVMRGVFEREPAHLGDCLDALAEQSFVIVDIQTPTTTSGQDLVLPEPAYLEYVVGYPAGKSPENDFPQLVEVLKNLGDYEGLYYIGNAYVRLYSSWNAYALQWSYDEAIEAYNSALRIKPDYSPALNMARMVPRMVPQLVHFKKGLVLNGMERYEEAIDAFDSALEINPDYSPVAFVQKSRALNMLGRSEEALESVNSALEIFPDYPEALVQKGVALYGVERYEEAIDAFDSALEINPDYLQMFFQKSLARFDTERYEEALETLGSLSRTEVNAAKSQIPFLKGLALYAMERYEEAIDAFDSALEIIPDYPEAFVEKGRALDQLGRDEEAIDAFDSALRIRPDYPEAFVEKGLALGGVERYEEAIDAFDSALEIIPDYPEAILLKSVTLTELGRHQEALEAVEKALRLIPEDPDAWVAKSLILFNLGHHEQALEASDKALNLTPDYSEAFQSKGMALAGLGRREEAREWLSRAWDAREQLPDKGAEVEEKLRELGHDSEEDG